MAIDLNEGVALLGRTPNVLQVQLSGLPEAWITADEGPGTWSPFGVVGHFIHGEKTDWIPRACIILDQGEDGRFEPFDRFAQDRETGDRNLDDLLYEFASLRTANLEILAELDLGPAELALTGIHPEFGTVTLAQLLATWVAHDLVHLAQIDRVLARRLTVDVGPWRKYLTLLG